VSSVTDRHYPSILIDLCQAHRRGEDCMYALHDALCEIGYPHTAAWHFGADPRRRCDPGDGCVVVMRILHGWSIDDLEAGSARPQLRADSQT
jgi:hypothetical protein